MTTGILARPRSLIGVLLKDWRRYRQALRAPGLDYLTLCNRNERLVPAADGTGFRCDWQWTSDLHAPKVLPSLGRDLTRRAFADHPIKRVAQPESDASTPEVSFLIGHRGTARLPHLLATLESIAGQTGTSIECIVVEQDTEARLVGKLPKWVQHVHTPPPNASMPYCRSWTFNVGVQHALGRVLILHDNDMLVPHDYASSIVSRIDSGNDVVNLKRFVFYLSEDHSRAMFSSGVSMFDQSPLAITQNLEAGGSIAITREAFARIGGMDERFIGWGGEDNEFWERAQTLRVWPYASLPILHLWHAAQPGKQQADNETLKRYQALSAVPVGERIDALCSSGRGLMSGPSGWPQ